jgi:hypothetical protein
VGFKFGKWLDVIYMQLTLTGSATEMAPSPSSGRGLG